MGKKVKKSYQRLLMATMVALAASMNVKMALLMGSLFEILTSYCRILFLPIISLP